MSDWSLTNLELQRMLYISNMLYLGKYEKPLVEGCFQARIYGPVHVQLYEKVKEYGLSPIPSISFELGFLDKRLNKILNKVRDLDNSKHKNEIEILDKVIKMFPNRGFPLAEATHHENSAWRSKYVSNKNVIIDKSDMIKEYATTHSK